MDYQIGHRSDALAPATGRLPAAQYFNVIMTCTAATALIGEGFWLARDPDFAIGGMLAGASIATGTLGLILGLTWLFRVVRARR